MLTWANASPRGTLWFLTISSSYINEALLGVKLGVFYWALKPVLGFSGKNAPAGLWPAGAPQLPRRRHATLPYPPPSLLLHFGYKRPHVTSTMASGKRIDGLKIGKDTENWKHQMKLFQKLSEEVTDGVTPDTCPTLPRWP